MMFNIEATVWCAHCETDKFRVVRRPTGREGVFENVTVMIDSLEICDSRKTCEDCKEPLSRKE